MTELHESCSKFFGTNKKACSNVLMAFQQRTNRVNGGSTNTLKAGQHIQFVNFVINSDEFITHFNSEFGSVVARVFPGATHSELRESMGGDYLKTRVTKQQRLVRQDLITYLKETPYFETYYTDFIREVYRFYFSDTIGKHLTNDLLKRVREEYDFENDNVVSVDHYMHNIVREQGGEAFDETARRQPLSDTPFQAMFQMRFDRLPEMDEIREFNDFMTNESKMITMYFETRYKRYNVFAKRVCDRFFSIFNRDITSFELIKYYDTFTQGGENETDECIRRYYENFTIKFNKVVTIFKDFLNEPVDYFEFVKRYIDYMEENDTNYDETIIDIVIGYDGYQNVMHNQIRSVYKSTFDHNITDHDMNYFYERAHKDRLSIVCESLPIIVSTLKRETDEYIATIHEIVMRVLNRKADLTEEVTYIDYFRHKPSNLKPEIRLENELYESLEYHDVLKEAIANQFAGDKQLGRSELFKMLTHILKVPDKMLKRDARAVFDELNNNYYGKLA